MRALAMLRRRHLAILWSGQVLSAVGDQLYLVALLWMGVGLSGSLAALLPAASASAGLAFGLFGGVFADRYDRRRTMILTDLARGALVSCVPLLAARGPLSLAPLIVVASLAGALTAVFLPALHASLPALTNDVDELHA